MNDYLEEASLKKYEWLLRGREMMKDTHVKEAKHSIHKQ